ncbi:MAG: hypothetical protein P0Y56_01405 [Candidatus Andeanibacterium colombiense]|uniref:Uncharacterized protein n=1 Tax=Candidatus Andeanibacterium colombiense TaxID=3121345 RepID=A0AAJ5X6Q6_9SPHN|nr:MAG: hypothetical protein P0Y56_01405 [Sphingomonadaceae bacterium]
MNAQRLKAFAGTAALVSTIALASSATPAAAQASDANVLSIMRECAKISDPSARLACYDNNIRMGVQSGAIPGAGGPVRGGGAVIAGGSGNGAQGFGAKSMKSPDRFQSGEDRGEGPDEIRAKITDVAEREPGIWRVTLDDGAEWTFSESVARSFRVPRKGALVEIQKASLGSFLMIVDGQQGVRVRRTK